MSEDRRSHEPASASGEANGDGGRTQPEAPTSAFEGVGPPPNDSKPAMRAIPSPSGGMPIAAPSVPPRPTPRDEKKRARMTLRIPDDEVSRPDAPGTGSIPPASSLPDIMHPALPTPPAEVVPSRIISLAGPLPPASTRPLGTPSIHRPGPVVVTPPNGEHPVIPPPSEPTEVSRSPFTTQLDPREVAATSSFSHARGDADRTSEMAPISEDIPISSEPPRGSVPVDFEEDVRISTPVGALAPPLSPARALAPTQPDLDDLRIDVDVDAPHDEEELKPEDLMSVEAVPAKRRRRSRPPATEIAGATTMADGAQVARASSAGVVSASAPVVSPSYGASLPHAPPHATPPGATHHFAAPVVLPPSVHAAPAASAPLSATSPSATSPVGVPIISSPVTVVAPPAAVAIAGSPAMAAPFGTPASRAVAPAPAPASAPSPVSGGSPPTSAVSPPLGVSAPHHSAPPPSSASASASLSSHTPSGGVTAADPRAAAHTPASPSSRLATPGGSASALAPPAMTDAAAAAARRKNRPWWEELFNDDFIRTMAKVSDGQIGTEVNFIEESLGLAKNAMVLDLACGTGRHAIELAKRGYQVVGFDLSLAMLAKAADEAADRAQVLNFVQGDMREMTFEDTFDGVYCWNTSFGFFEEEKNANVIARVHRALKSGGMLLLDVANRDYLLRQQPSLAWFEGEGCICMDEMSLDWITSRMKVKRTMMMDDGRTREIEYSIRVYALHELGKILHEQGFRVAEVSGRTGTPGVFFGSESPRTLILAEKR